MVDEGDSQARTVQKGHDIACHVNFLENLKGKECANLSGHIQDIKLHHHQNQRRGGFIEPCRG
jgi:hypothetical protein